MTIAHGTASEHGFEGGDSRAASSAATSVDDAPVPVRMRADRLTLQIAMFERAGYRLETRTAVQAVVVKPRERRPLRSALLTVATVGLYLVPVALGARRTYHRVVITVDGSGAVSIA